MAVLGVDADVVADPDALGAEVVGDAVGPLVELDERQPGVAVDERDAFGDGVDDVLEQVSNVVCHE